MVQVDFYACIQPYNLIFMFAAYRLMKPEEASNVGEIVKKFASSLKHPT